MNADYTILRRREDLRELLKVILEEWEESIGIMFSGCLKSTLRGHYLFEAVVDKWPGFSSVLLRYNQVEKQDIKVHEYYLVGRDEKDVEKMLYAENIIDWSTPFIFKTCRMEHLDMLLKCGERHDGRFEVPATAPIYVFKYPKLHVMRDLKTTRPLLPGFRVGKLLPEHAQMINSIWAYGAGKEMEDQIRHHIMHLPSVCVYHNEKPVSWGLIHRDGSAGYGYTHPDYRRLGISTMVMEEMIRQMEQWGIVMYGVVATANTNAQALHRKFKCKQYPDKWTFLWFRPQDSQSKI